MSGGVSGARPSMLIWARSAVSTVSGRSPSPVARSTWVETGEGPAVGMALRGRSRSERPSAAAATASPDPVSAISGARSFDTRCSEACNTPPSSAADATPSAAVASSQRRFTTRRSWRGCRVSPMRMGGRPASRKPVGEAARIKAGASSAAGDGVPHGRLGAS